MPLPYCLWYSFHPATTHLIIPALAAQQSVSWGKKLFIAVSAQVPTRCPCPSAKLTFKALQFACSDWMEEILPPEITANPLRTYNTLTRPILFLALHTSPPFCFPLPLLLACELAVWWECNPSRLLTERRIESVDAGTPCLNASMPLLLYCMHLWSNSHIFGHSWGKNGLKGKVFFHLSEEWFIF